MRTNSFHDSLLPKRKEVFALDFYSPGASLKPAKVKENGALVEDIRKLNNQLRFLSDEQIGKMSEG